MGSGETAMAVWELFAVGCSSWVWWSIGWNVLMGNSTLDIHLHDTYYVVSGYHYTFLLPLIIFVLTVIYYLLECKVSVDRALGRLHFWITFIGLWYLLWPGTYEGMAGMPRRYLDYSDSCHYGFNRFIQVNHTMA